MAFITSRAPFRISFFGGGTDYPAWYRQEGGAVLSTSIDKYCYLTCRYLPPFFPQKHRIVWSHIENVTSIGEILHPAVREGLRMLNFTDERGLEIHHHGDLPARAGMGSSSAFANGLILALKTLRGEAVSRADLFRLALTLEQDWLRDNVGSQDQVATAVGGLNVIEFHPDDRIDVTPVMMAETRWTALQDRLMLFYSGTSRMASVIAGKMIAGIHDRAAELRQMRRMVDEARQLLEGDGDLDTFGAMLHETWMRKRGLCEGISNDGIDRIYDAARRAGALGGKLLGAGSAGFLLFYVPETHQPAVKMALESLLHVPFRFEFGGTTIIGNGATG
ncbi:MAG: kinase [Alphaproteobacteria bacterium]